MRLEGAVIQQAVMLGRDDSYPNSYPVQVKHTDHRARRGDAILNPGMFNIDASQMSNSPADLDRSRSTFGFWAEEVGRSVVLQRLLAEMRSLVGLLLSVGSRRCLIKTFPFKYNRLHDLETMPETFPDPGQICPNVFIPLWSGCTHPLSNL